jgi:gas vesicle protein
MKATNVKLSTATIDAIGAWSSKSREADNNKVKAIDSLFADGVTSAMLMAPKKGESTVLFDSVKVSVVLGFTATIQALLKKDTKSLSEAQKETKRFWQMQIGSKVKDLRKALASREAKAKAEMEGSDGAGADKASWESVKRTVLADMIKQAQGKEATTIKDMAAFIKDLQSALARIPAKA